MEVREMTKDEIIEAKTQHIKNHLDRITQLETENKRLRVAHEETIKECAGFDEPPSNYWKDELLARAYKRARECLNELGD